jgi:putative oxidoreductase
MLDLHGVEGTASSARQRRCLRPESKKVIRYVGLPRSRASSSKIKAEVPMGRKQSCVTGCHFARSLIATGLIDEHQFLVHLVVAGSGLSIFSEPAKPRPEVDRTGTDFVRRHRQDPSSDMMALRPRLSGAVQRTTLSNWKVIMTSRSLIWARAAILVARLIFAAVFGMAMSFKFAGIHNTASYIAAAGFPFALFLAWIAAFFELALVLCFLIGAFFTEAAIAAAAYVLFLGFAFHGPAYWSGSQTEFGFFVDHFVFLAGLLFAAVHGPGDVLALTRARLIIASI